MERAEKGMSHDCQREVRGVNYEYERNTLGHIMGTITVVLERCDICGSLTTQRIKGKWTLQEITGSTSMDSTE